MQDQQLSRRSASVHGTRGGRREGGRGLGTTAGSGRTAATACVRCHTPTSVLASTVLTVTRVKGRQSCPIHWKRRRQCRLQDPHPDRLSDRLSLLTIGLSIYLSISLSIALSVHLTIRLPIHRQLTVGLAIRLTVCLSIGWRLTGTRGRTGVLFVFLVLDFVEVVNSSRVAATRHSVLANGGQNHSLSQTLLETTVLTSVSLLLRDAALAVRDTRVHALVLNRPFEKPFATLARDDPVVQSCRSVLTDHADHRLILFFLLLLLTCGRTAVALHLFSLLLLLLLGLLLLVLVVAVVVPVRTEGPIGPTLTITCVVVVRRDVIIVDCGRKGRIGSTVNHGDSRGVSCYHSHMLK